MIVGITISNSQVYFLGFFFFEKNFLQFGGNKGIYSVGKGKTSLFAKQRVPRVLRWLASPKRQDRKSTRLNSSHSRRSRMPSSA